MEQEKNLLWLFDLGLILKAIDGGLEVLGAVLVLVVRPMVFVKIIEFVTAGELASDPDDIIANYLRSAAHSFAVHSHYFFAAYLALHGAIKIILVIGILRGKRIAYPLFIGALGIFGAYEAYRGIRYDQVFLQALAVFDLVMLALTAYEYRRRFPRTVS